MRAHVVGFVGLLIAAMAVAVASPAFAQPFTAPHFDDFDRYATGSGAPDAAVPNVGGGWTNATGDQFDWQVFAGATATSGTGPSVDHSTNATFGQYIYAESSAPRAAGDVARLVSPILDATGATNAGISFWLHQFGTTPGLLHVDVIEHVTGGGSITYNDIIPASAGNSNAWTARSFMLALVPFTANWTGKFQIVFRAEIGAGGSGDMAIDDFHFTTAAGEPEIDVQRPAATSRPNNATDFIAGSPRAGQPIALTYTVANLAASAALNVTNVSVSNATNCSAAPSATSLAVAAGNSQTVTVTAIPGAGGAFAFTLTFTSDDLDEAAYAITVLGTAVAVLSPPYVENFDSLARGTGNGNYAGENLGNQWTNANGDDFDWQVYGGATPTSGTGPSADHTTHSAAGNYVYAEGSGNSPAKVARLLSPRLDGNAAATSTVEFWYHLYGAEMGTLHVDVIEYQFGGTTAIHADVMAAVSSHADVWKRGTFLVNSVPFSANWSGEFQVVFRCVSGSGFRTDMAIDDFAFETFDDPEIEIQRPAGTVIANGGTDSLGTSSLLLGMFVTYTVRNLGSTNPLDVTGVTFANAQNCSASASGVPLTVPANASSAFTVTIFPSGRGAFSVDMTIANTDPSESTTTITIIGAVNYSGTITVNANAAANPTFTDLGAAFTALETYGISGATIVEIYDDGGAYTSTAAYTLGALPGTSAANTLTIRAASGEKPVVQGGGATSGIANAGLILRGCQFVTVEGIEFDGQSTATVGIAIYGATNDATNSNTVRRCVVHDVLSAGIAVMDAGGAVAECADLRLESNALYKCGGATVNGVRGVLFLRGAKNATVIYNTIINAEAATAIAVVHEQGTAGREAGAFSNNIVYAAVGTAAYLRAGADFIAANANIWHLGAGVPFAAAYADFAAWQAAGFDANGVAADPLLTDAANGDFTLTGISSPAVDAASASFGVTTDIHGDTRPTGTGKDIGADEFVPATNLAPVVTVKANGTTVANNGTVNVAHNSTLAALNLQISVTDFESNTTTLTATLGGITSEGLVLAEFQATGAPPLSRTPSTGTFTVGGAAISVSLSASDGAATAFAFTIQVGATQPSLTIAANNPADASVARGSANVRVGEFTLAAADGDITLTAVNATASGSAIDTADITELALWQDADVSGAFETATDTKLASGTFSANDGTLTFTPATAPTITAGQSIRVFVVASVSAVAAGGRTFAVALANPVATTPNNTVTFVAFPISTSTITVAVPPMIASTAPTTAVVGMAVNYTIATTGTPKPTLAVTNLPAWLTFTAATETISGTPGAGDVGTTGAILVTASNGFSPDATQSFSLTVSTTGTAPGITSAAPTAGLVGKPFRYKIAATGTPSPTVSVSGLPTWLSFDSATATISGTPSAVHLGTTGTITVTAANGVAPDATQNFTVTVGAPTLAVGDVMVMGFRSDAPDGFAFVVWKAVAAGAKISFTDNGFDGAAFASGEGILTWTAPVGGVAAGSVILCTDAAAGTFEVGTGSGTLADLSDAGDQIFVYEGDLHGGANLIFGINFGNAGWLTVGSPTANDSHLPAALASAFGSLNVGTLSSQDNGTFAGSRSSRAVLADYKPDVLNLANWQTTDDGAALALDGTDFSAANNVPPTIIVTIGGVRVTAGEVRQIALNQALAGLNVAIEIADPNAHATTLTTTISNVTSEGIDAANEWSSASAAVPYTLSPATGSFSVNDTDHVITLAADDGNGGQTSLSFTLRVGTPAPPAEESGSDSPFGCAAKVGVNGGGAWWLWLWVAAIFGWSLRRFRR